MGLFGKKPDPGAMPDPKKVKPDKINPATGRPHRDDPELYALRDASAARRAARIAAADKVNPATGRPHRDDAAIEARRAGQDRVAAEAIRLAERAYQQRLGRRNSAAS